MSPAWIYYAVAYKGGSSPLAPPGHPRGACPPWDFWAKVFWVKKRACPHHQRGVFPLKKYS